ncbi:glycosyl hydrolase [Thermomicrobium sp. 4228-Ro]|uniref:exo-alpha-sialidase n=1 Tax=Thermomicrobium sp. 4228-Ro TaxID=2993937 RepID=UPI0022493EFE|nr:exo-alpha-sialidase [Thermomicrobium sp. 4228-Ro]MCX2726974.1 glycosyl hydrolase [Thermomicrobium sp. 4228-Ro]
MPRDSIGRLTGALRFRCIGPHRGGRVVAVAGHPDDPMVFYFGACAGGVWKSEDGGTTWWNVSDGFFQTAAVGALAIAPSDPNVLYVGTGEACIRGNVSHGDGVYKSTDGGRTWVNVGLRDTRHIAKIRVHPHDPDLVYVAALGHAFGPNEERGVFRSRDGGRTWERVLYRDEHTGAIDLVMDPHNPRILYAALWQARRWPWKLESGGPGSGIFRSTDGGETWEELTRKPGLPRGIIGRVGLAVSAKPGRLWALVEAEDGALFRSEDYGETWQRVSEKGDLRWRAWYFHHLCADPVDPDTLWVLDLKLWKSIDGGKTFTEVPTPHGDHHDHWIDPKNPLRMINGNDGGACVSFDGGRTWSTQFNQPTAQLYHVTVDNRFPYWVYGSQQDNTAIALPSRSVNGAITTSEWEEPGGGESGHIAVKPDDPDIVIGGAIGSGEGNGRLIRYNRRTGEQRNITVWPYETSMAEGAESLRYRFQWTFPILFSPHDPNTLYVCSQVVHRSRDLGYTWEVISPDLTRNDPEKLKPSGGPITRDNTGAEVYCTIFAFVESPHQQGVFWAGTDDGLVHVSRDGGATWENVTPPGLPEWATVASLEVSPHDPETVYLAAHRYRLDDPAPYLFKTSDGGKTWVSLRGDLPAEAICRVLRVDPVKPGLLYLGTETGLWISFDDGQHWHRWQGNLPVCPVYDLVVKDDDLVVATHGRSFWILDDLTPLRQFDPTLLDGPAYLFAPRPTVRFKTYPGFGSEVPNAVNYRWAGPIVYAAWVTERPTGIKEAVPLDAGQNPPDGAVITYYLAEEPAEVTLSILDAEGRELRRFSSEKPADPYPDLPEEKKPSLPPRLDKTPGFHRFVWDLRAEGARRVIGDRPYEGYLVGPRVVPGTYQVRLTVGDRSWTQPLEIRRDPRLSVTQEDLQRQYDLLLRVRDKVSEAHDAINRLRDARHQLVEWQQRLEASSASEVLRERVRGLSERLGALVDELLEPRMDDPRQFPPRAPARLAILQSFVDSADDRPTAGEEEVSRLLAAEIDEILGRVRQALEEDLPALARELVAAGASPIVPRPVLARP